MLAVAVNLVKQHGMVGSGQDMAVATCPFGAFIEPCDFALAGCFTRLLLSQ